MNNNELERKLAWLTQRHQKQHELVEKLESNGAISRQELLAAKKEKLRLKDFIASLEKLSEKLS